MKPLGLLFVSLGLVVAAVSVFELAQPAPHEAALLFLLAGLTLVVFGVLAIRDEKPGAGR
ncbi:hypothetical protein [Nonomuraea recticatena]|uniref:Uncharacterized protein n=1 Tax=Nonomuraea recticatena TaxID=46178 RepID=A0ABN3TG41_9ACTN